METPPSQLRSILNGELYPSITNLPTGKLLSSYVSDITEISMFYTLKLFDIRTSNYMFVRAIWGKFPACTFENFEGARVTPGQFQNFQKFRG